MKKSLEISHSGYLSSTRYRNTPCRAHAQMLYSGKYWKDFKFGSLAIFIKSAKFNSLPIFDHVSKCHASWCITCTSFTNYTA